ncbi:hypothetical protein [Actinoplanes teichomyceticus]|uniref:Uncharacterized protein n=1 Tax=Actinoplanes teichomyceticus TaxID=1867 RepID=A0A561WQT9_ACTTI|nr:hypothetical protein [Actinoplanes teichomyceticus]TWG26219.1 hypothetical protein FHX34_1011200 [Actinoplanes teichomyceticus]GIF11298.1 hypothetical protein Ate01nite_13300 [Actinoplanes teichomyceticus]
MRGGLDDALDKLARRDELRRRAAAGESPGTPPAVTELVEAIAGVVARHPNLGVTVGVEGAGDPVLLHFAFADGTVQVRADRPVADRPAAEGHKHADFEINLDDPEPPPRGSHDDQDRFGPTDYDYAAEPPTAERPFVSPQPPAPPAAAYSPPPAPPPAAYSPPPVPPHRPGYPAPHAEPTGFREPMPKPVPFQAGPPEETELAARRLAAMLRDNPSLLDDAGA